MKIAPTLTHLNARNWEASSASDKDSTYWTRCSQELRALKAIAKAAGGLEGIDEMLDRALARLRAASGGKP